MGDLRDRIIDKISRYEQVEESLKTLKAVYEEALKNGGSASFVLRPKNAIPCTTEINLNIAGEFISLLSKKYENILKETIKEIDKCLEEELENHEKIQSD